MFFGIHVSHGFSGRDLGLPWDLLHTEDNGTFKGFASVKSREKPTENSHPR